MNYYSNLSEHQLILLAERDKTQNKHINIEWRKRYGMNFPYKLNIAGKIENVILGALVGDRECDMMILQQANQLRERRGVRS